MTVTAFYKVGERCGPATVVYDELEIKPNGDGVEYVITSNDTRIVMPRPDVDASYRKVLHYPPDGRPLVAYTYQDQRTLDGMNAADQPAIWVDVSGSDFDYWSVLCDFWTPEHDLTIIEHDVVARPDVFTTFEECPEPWCVFPYSNHSTEDAEAWRNMLGCTRFRKELIAEVPDALTGIEERWREWRYTCDGIGANLRAKGFSHHWHGPAVYHHQGR